MNDMVIIRKEEGYNLERSPIHHKFNKSVSFTFHFINFETFIV